MTDHNALVQRLADAVPGWGARVAYGDKTTVDGKEIIPVAIATWGFGAGEGSGSVPESDGPVAGTGEGSGGGGGGLALPIGAYVTGEDGLEFEPNPVAVLIAATPAIVAIAASVACVIATIGSVKAIFRILDR